MAVKIQIRRDSSTNWTNTNPVLAQGELGLELDTGFIKAGNGTNNWNDLPYLFEFTEDLIPFADNTYDLGSSTKRYKDGYFKGKLFTEKVLSGDILLTDSFYNTSRTITIPAPDAGGETIGGVPCHTYIQNVIDSLPKYIPSGATVIITFSDGTYKFSATNTILIEGLYGGGELFIQGTNFTNNANVNQLTIFEDLNTNTVNSRWRFVGCNVKIDIRGIRFNGTGTSSRPFFFEFFSCPIITNYYVSYVNTAGEQRGVLAFCNNGSNLFSADSMFGKSEACYQANRASRLTLNSCKEEDVANKPNVIVILDNSICNVSTVQPDVAVSKAATKFSSLFVDGARTISTDT